MKVIQTYSSEECNSFDVFNSDNVLVAYYNEYFRSPIDNEKLDHVVIECYYDFEDVNDSSSSTSIDVFDDFEEFNTNLLQIVESSYFAS
jgi:hypothetical protein